MLGSGHLTGISFPYRLATFTLVKIVVASIKRLYPLLSDAQVVLNPLDTIGNYSK